MGSKESLQYNRFEIYSNKGDKSVDIRAGTPIIEYRESVFTPFVQISVIVIETGNSIDGMTVLEGLTLQGTETVKFEIEDPNKKNKITFDGDDDLVIGKLSNVTQSFKNTNYSLNVVSKEIFNNTLVKCRIRRKLNGRISDIVRDIIREDLKSDKPVFVDKTDRPVSFDGFDDSPFQKILDLQRLAVPEGLTGKSAGYLFWETSDGYHFKSLDKLFDTTGKVIKKYIENKSSSNVIPYGYDDKIVWSKIDRTIDALEQFENGAYGSDPYYYDPVTKEFVKGGVKTPPPEGTAEIAGTELPQFNSKFSGEATDRMILKKNTGGSFAPNDTLSRQVEKFTEEDIVVEDIAWQAKQNFRQKFNMSVEVIIPADFGLHAGDLIRCDFPEISSKKTRQESQKDSGIYMIADLIHYGDKSQSYTGLHLVRDSFGIK